MWAPQLAIGEALHAVVRQFVDLIVSKSPSPTDGVAGLRVVRPLEAATQSMADQGRPVSVVDTAAS